MGAISLVFFWRRHRCRGVVIVGHGLARRALRRAAQRPGLRRSDPRIGRGSPSLPYRPGPRSQRTYIRGCRPRRYPSPGPGLVDGVGDRASARTPSQADRPGAPERDPPRRIRKSDGTRWWSPPARARDIAAVPPSRARRPAACRRFQERPCPQNRSQTQQGAWSSSEPASSGLRSPPRRIARRSRHARRSLATPLTSARRRNGAVAREALPRPRDRPWGRSHARPDRCDRGESTACTSNDGTSVASDAVLMGSQRGAERPSQALLATSRDPHRCRRTHRMTTCITAATSPVRTIHCWMSTSASSTGRTPRLRAARFQDDPRVRPARRQLPSSDGSI